MDSGCRIIDVDTQNRFITVKCAERQVVLPVEDIIFAESFNKTVVIHTTTSQYTVTAKIGVLFNMVQSLGFIQIHKSYFVNLKHIAAMKNYVVTLSGGIQLAASQRRWKYIKDIYSKKNTVRR